MSDQVLTLVLKGDGTGLTGTVRVAEADAKRLGAAFDAVGKNGQGMGATSKRVAGDVNTLASAERRAEGSSRSLAAGINTLRATLGALGIGVLVRDVIQAGMATDRYNLQLMAATGNQRQASREMAFLREQAQRLGIYLPSMVEGYAGLSAATRGTVLEGKQTRDIFIGVAEAARVMNLDTASTQGVFVALQQIAGKGVVSMEELRQQLGDRMPGAMQMAASAMDMTVAQFVKAVSEGKVLSNDLLPKLAQKMHEFAAASLDAATKLPVAQFQRLKTAIFDAAASLANGGFLQTLGKSAGDAADALKKLTDTGAIQKFGAAIATAAKILATLYSVKLLQSGREWIAQLTLQNGLLGGLIVKQSQWGAATAASFATAFKQIGLIGIGLNTLAASILGWQVGAYLRDNFIEARLFGIAFINGMLKGWEYLKQGALIAWEAIKVGFRGAINAMRDLLASFIDSYARLASIIPSFMGGDKVTGALSSLADRVRSTTSAADGFSAAVAKINTEAAANRAHIDAITDDMADYAIAQQEATRATQSTAAAANANAVAQGNQATATNEAAKAMRDLAAAEQEMYAESIRSAEIPKDATEAWADLTAQLAGPLAQAEREHVKRLDEIKTAGLAAGVSWDRINAAIAQENQLYADQSPVADAARQAAEDFRYSWMNAVQSVGNAFGDWMTGTISSFSDFGRTLVNIARRWGSDLISKGFSQLFNGGFANAGGAASSGGGLFETIVGGVARLFGFGGGGAQRGMNAAAQAAGTATGAGWTNPFTPQGGAQMAGFGGMAVAGPGAAGAGGGMQFPSSYGMLTGEFASGFPYASAALGVGGLYYGLTQRGNGGLSSGLAGLSYGALGVGVGGALAGGLGALGTSAGIGGMAAGATAGAGSAMAGLGAASWIPVVGWVLAAAALVDAISGGKLFGTKYKPESSAVSLAFGPDGASGQQQVTEVRQKALFGGRSWRTTNHALSAEAQAGIDQVFAQIQDSMRAAAVKLGVTVPDVVAATFKAEYDKKGKLVKESGTIAGRTYNEDQETFFKRYALENLLAVAKQAGHASEIEQLANGYRDSVEHLQDFATLVLAIQQDLQATNATWADGAGALTRMVDAVKGLQQEGESLAATYTRLSATAQQYGQLIAGVRGELLTHGLSDYAKAQLQVELQYREQVKQANDLAKALGLSGARAEDLASIEQLRAQRMADLQQQMEKQRDQFLGGLRLSDFAPGTDQDKLTDAMAQLRTAVAAGDLQGAQQLAQNALGFGRNLYASGSDYNALYGTVTGLLEDLDPAAAGLTATALQSLADTLSTLPQDIASAFLGMLAEPAQLPPPPSSPTALPAASAPAVTSPSGTGSAATLEAIAASTAATAAATDELLRQQLRADIKSANVKVPA